jgi:hypothetical protein
MASWITAFAAVVALVLAALTLLTVRGMHKALTERFGVVRDWYEASRLDRWRAQASLVCAWPVSERETFEKIITRGVVGAAVRNASEVPVYDVEIVYRDPDAAWTAMKRVRMVPPAAGPEVYAGFDEEETNGEPHPERINEDGTIRLAPSADMHLELRFTDAQGRRWVRDDEGRLGEAAQQLGDPSV